MACLVKKENREITVQTGKWVHPAKEVNVLIHEYHAAVIKFAAKWLASSPYSKWHTVISGARGKDGIGYARGPPGHAGELGAVGEQGYGGPRGERGDIGPAGWLHL